MIRCVIPDSGARELITKFTDVVSFNTFYSAAIGELIVIAVSSIDINISICF